MRFVLAQRLSYWLGESTDLLKKELVMTQDFTRATLLATAIAAILASAPTLSAARDADLDNATARRQAMDEWYNETYSQRGHSDENARRHKKALFSASYERFLMSAANSERLRNGAMLPQSGTSRPVIDATLASAATGTTWANIGPTKANYAQNGGTTLNSSDSGRVRNIVTDPANSQTVYVAFAGGGVWKSTDGGAFWSAKTETLGSLSVGSLEMDPNNANTLYLGLGDPFDGTGIGLVKSTNGGDAWSAPIFLGDSSVIPDIAVVPGNSSIVMVATNKGLYRSTDGGSSYAKVTIATGSAESPYVWSIASGGGSNWVISLEADPSATATNGQIWRSADNGATWTRTTSGLTDAGGLARMTVASAPSLRTTLYALAAKSTFTGSSDFANVFKSTNGGSTWTAMGSTTKGGRVTYKSYTNKNTESTALSTVLNGQGWYGQMIVVDPTNPNSVFFGGALLLAKTADGGSTYSQASNWLAQFSLPYVHADMHAGYFSNDGKLFVGSDGGIFLSTNAGTSWTATLNEGIASHLVYQVGSSTANTNAVIVGLQDNGTRVRVSNTGVFNQEIGGDGFGCDVNQTNANQMLGSLYYSRIQKSTDAGLNFASACSGITECNNSSTAPFITVLSRWAGDSTGNTLFTYSNTKVYKTTNYAGAWAALGVSGLPTTSFYIRGVSAAKTNASVIGVVANGGRVFLTNNGGSTWTTPAVLPNNGLSLSSIAFDPIDSNTIYVTSVAPDQTKNHIWKSTNFGASWAVLDAGGFPAGIPVNSIQADPITGTTLYAGAHMGVYRSLDSGATWSRYGAGMPLVNVTDVYVAADDSLVRAATFGRSVWELTP
jgi:hypothetical protein